MVLVSGLLPGGPQVEGGWTHLGVQELHAVAGVQQLLLRQPSGPLRLLQGHLYLL